MSEHQQDLAKQVARLQRELETLKTDFQEYAYIVSHDLSGPFRTTSSLIDIILRTKSDQLDTNTQKHLTVLQKEANIGTNKIKSLLSYSRLGSKLTDVQVIDTNALCAKVVAQLSELDAFSCDNISIADLPNIYGNDIQIEQVFYALIHNAITFRDPEKTLLISISAITYDDKYEFVVQDNGMGIKEIHKEKVFQVFKRCVPNDHSTGEGMGLAIVKKILMLHKGGINIDFTYTEGCKMIFSIAKGVEAF